MSVYNIELKGELIMKFVVYEGCNKFESNSRNARKHIIDGGYDRVRIETKTGKFVCAARRDGDGSITVWTTDYDA